VTDPPTLRAPRLISGNLASDCKHRYTEVMSSIVE
jgi:hypothetical protein